jgi:hypothetical protein
VDCLVDGEAAITAKLMVHLQAHLPRNHSTVPEIFITRYPLTGVNTPRDGIGEANVSLWRGLHHQGFVNDTNNEVIDKDLQDDKKMDKLPRYLNSKVPTN